MIVLARHGQTESVKGRCIGRTHVPLSETGHEQAARLANSLSSIDFARICSSPSRRAVNTLEPLAQQCGLSMKVIPELDEINMGEWDGLLFDDIRRRFPEAYAERGRRFGDFRPPGGESFNDVGDRVLKVLAELGAGPKPIFAVTHAGVIRATLCRATGRPMDALFHFSPGHAECTVFAPSTRGLELVVTGIAPEDLGSFL